MQEHGYELLVIDVPVPVDVGLGYQLLALLLRQLVPQSRENLRQIEKCICCSSFYLSPLRSLLSLYLAEVGNGDKPVPFLVKHPESFPYFLFDVAVLVDVLRHEVDKLVEAYAAVPVLVNFVYHFLERK